MNSTKQQAEYSGCVALRGLACLISVIWFSLC
jgi:hypothetical protein